MMSPPLPPSPPSGPPLGTNFSRRKLTHPRPPSPAWAKTLIRSTNIPYYIEILPGCATPVPDSVTPAAVASKSFHPAHAHDHAPDEPGRKRGVAPDLHHDHA